MAATKICLSPGPGVRSAASAHHPREALSDGASHKLRITNKMHRLRDQKVSSSAADKRKDFDTVILFQFRIKPIQVHNKSPVLSDHNVRPESLAIAVE